ncbi:hypothetical protein BD311DRAFT_505466 [Dichomitus squalens]|uniref:Heterokaryon incompatibility domain-containing protein n=1 Tax=Dichomitus squalens TaxID=114155 RepID=A0A4Q9MF01_9APHY|nr:hypothetical protein BD311DRAFT_505466 [Dichomitus squalens]
MVQLIRVLIEGVPGIKVPMDRLVLPHDSDMQAPVISGDNLARLLVPWARQMLPDKTNSLHDLEYYRERRRKAKEVLSREVHALDQVLSKRSYDFEDPPYALAIFLASLHACAREVWGSDKAAFRWFDNTKMLPTILGILRRNLAYSWGYKISLERIIGAGIPFIAYATSCQPTLNKVDVVNMDRDPNNIPHVAPGCTCALVKPSIEAVRTSYSEDDVPAVILDGNGLTVRPASKGPYVAISHVWADGLGSSTEYGLPLCQVERLDGLVLKLVPDGAFWHDGLCVPSPETQRPTWQRAIRLLARIYARADKVLVVDGGVRTQCSLAKPVEERLLRIATSGWAQRIWTLQEGVLARELYFEVADGFIDCSRFDGEASYLATCLIPSLQYRLDDGDSKFQRRLWQRPRCSLNDLIRLLRLRSTSYPEDEPLAIAGLLNIGAEKLASLEDRERMKALLLEVREVPHNLLLYGWDAERLSVPKFTWAPALLSKVYWSGRPEDTATCTEAGLCGEFTIVRFPTTSVSMSAMVTTTPKPELLGTHSASGHGEEPTPAFGANGVAFFDLRLSDCAKYELDYNAFLTNCKVRELNLRPDQPVAVVQVMSNLASGGANSKLHCRYVRPGSVD